MPVVVYLLSPGIGDNVELGNYAKQAGADAVMVVTPYYVNPTRQGFIEYYQEFDRRLDMPIILYNIPYKTGIHLANDVVKEVVEKVPNVVGMKVCSDNIGDVLEVRFKQLGIKSQFFVEKISGRYLHLSQEHQVL